MQKVTVKQTLTYQIEYEEEEALKNALDVLENRTMGKSSSCGENGTLHIERIWIKVDKKFVKKLIVDEGDIKEQ